MHRYDECVGDLPDLTGRPCYAGLDLASTQDLSALVLVFPTGGGGRTLPRPSLLLGAWRCHPRPSHRDKVPYNVWRDQGFIEATPGAVIEYGYIMQRIDDLARNYDLRAVIFDRWGATAVVQELEAAGMEVIALGQGYKDMSPPTKELLKAYP